MDNNPPAEARLEYAAKLGERIAEKRLSEIWKELGSHRDLPDLDEISRFIRSLANESDRAVPVIFMAYMDTQIEKMLREELNPGVQGGIEGLFQPEGILGTFGARVKLSQAIGWISNDVAHDLNLLRKIRNEFAHNPSATFEATQVRGWISSLKFLDELMKMAQTPELEMFSKEEGWFLYGDERLPRTARLDFILAATFSLYEAVTQLYVSPAGQRSGFGPTALLAGEDLQPEWFRAFSEKAPEVLILAALYPEASRLGLRPLGEPD